MQELRYYDPGFAESEINWEEKKKRSTGSKKAPVVRTFRSDVDHALTGKVTSTQVIEAEVNRREARGEARIIREEGESHLGRTIFILTLLLATGVGIGAYAILGVKFTSPFKTSTSSPQITTDALTITLTDSPREQIFADILIAFGKTTLTQTNVRSILFIEKDASGRSRTASTPEFFTAISGTQPSPDLLGSLDTTLSYEIYSDGALYGRMMFNSRSYANSFAGMFDRESKLADEFTPLINPHYARKCITQYAGRTFHDEQLGGVNARVLSDPTGTVLLAYGFLDKKTLVIAGSRMGIETAVSGAAQQ